MSAEAKPATTTGRGPSWGTDGQAALLGVEHVERQRQQAPARVVGPQAAGDAVEQRGAEPALELGHVLRHRRRRVAERLGGGGRRAALDHLDERAQVGGVEGHHETLLPSSPDRNCSFLPCGAHARTMRNPLDLRGLWVPVVTPFTPDDRVDHDALARLAARLLDDGADGLVASAPRASRPRSPSRSAAPSWPRAPQVCGPRDRPLMVGCGTNATASTVAEVTAWSAAPGVDALLVVTPYYTRPSEPAVVAHVQAAAAASAVPVVVYNVPYRTGRGLGAASLLALAATPNVAGLKQAVGALDLDTLEVLRGAPEGFAVLAGDDAFAAPIVLLGGAGAIAAAAHLATPSWVAMVGAARAGDVAATRALAAALLPRRRGRLRRAEPGRVESRRCTRWARSPRPPCAAPSPRRAPMPRRCGVAGRARRRRREAHPRSSASSHSTRRARAASAWWTRTRHVGTTVMRCSCVTSSAEHSPDQLARRPWASTAAASIPSPRSASSALAPCHRSSTATSTRSSSAGSSRSTRRRNRPMTER